MNTVLDQKREQINGIDAKLIDLFLERMAVVKDVAAYKKEQRLPITNSSREREIIAALIKDHDPELAQYIKMLYYTIFDISHSYQEMAIMEDDQLQQMVAEALAKTAAIFPKQAIVACQGVAGANSSLAADRLFAFPSIMYMDNFDAVFKAVNSGLCNYGVLPLENTIHGSVSQVYDLMQEYNFQIVRSVKVKIDHCLLVKPGTKLKNIKEIYSHSQALAQCSKYLEDHKNIAAKEWANTALAAEMVANCDRDDIAAIADKSCAEIYNLEIINNHLQNRDNNYTRFICISKKAEIYPGADKISIMFTLPHKPGALYNLMAKFASLGINLSKLESRPMPDHDFEFVFYADIEANIAEPNIQKLLQQLEQSTETFSYLGSYHEI